MRRPATVCAIACAAHLALASCSAPDPDAPGPDASAETDARDAPAAPPRCAPAAGVSRSPGSIADVVALVNALPRPLTLACYLESLDRPLRFNATRGVISLQPAQGVRSPRMFFFSGRLVSSVVPEGSGGALMEFGEFIDQTRTLKGEIAFPIVGRLEPGDPYRRVRDAQQEGTTCRNCHRGEERFEPIAYGEAFASAALRPMPNERVDLERLRQEHAACDRAVEPQRCAFFDALFTHGEVAPWEFPETLPTIFY